MAGGYPAARGDQFAPLIRELKDIQRRLRELEVPTGTQVSSLVAQVQAALADITTTVTDAIAADSYTKSQIDAKVASPGAISPTTVTASGVVTADAGLNSLDARNRVLSSSYVSAYWDGTGRAGYVPSSLRFKTILDEYTVDLEDWLGLDGTWFTYDDDPGAVPRVGFIAEWVNVHFPEFVIHDTIEGEEGTHPSGLHYEFMIAGLHSAFKQFVTETREGMADLQTRLAALEG